MADSRKRLFFALWPDDATREAIVKSTGALVKASGGRAVLPQNLHITVAFLHNVDTALLPCIEAAARRASGNPLEIPFGRLGYWYRSRILWLAPADEDTAEITDLADTLWRELELCGFIPERRRYRPHITLARKAKSPPPVPNLAAPLTWRADSFALVQSITGRRQSEYVVIRTFPLD